MCSWGSRVRGCGATDTHWRGGHSSTALGRSLDEPAWAGASTSLADELLRPSVIYAPTLLAVGRAVEVHAFADITGGGLAGNVRRILPPDCTARIRRGSWPEPPIFGEVQRAGSIVRDEMEAVFNLGIGMVAAVASADVETTLAIVHERALGAWVIGEVVAGRGDALLADD